MNKAPASAESEVTLMQPYPDLYRGIFRGCANLDTNPNMPLNLDYNNI